jgi:hypothetical protein
VLSSGERAAALRAVTAARLYASGGVSLARAAECCGSNVLYLRAAIVLLKTENAALLDRVLRGRESLTAAANRAQHVADLMSAYRGASDADRVTFARTAGMDALLNMLVSAE